MTDKLTLKNILYAYDTLKKLSKKLSDFDKGRHIGYLEAGLQAHGYLETEKVGDNFQIKREIIMTETWYRKELKESITGAILRMTEKLLKDNDLL